MLKDVLTLSSSIRILEDELQDPTSVLLQSGDDRIHMVKEMMASIHDTLKKLKKKAKRYEILGKDSLSRRKQIWSKINWSLEFSSVESLRSKVHLDRSIASSRLTNS